MFLSTSFSLKIKVPSINLAFRKNFSNVKFVPKKRSFSKNPLKQYCTVSENLPKFENNGDISSFKPKVTVLGIGGIGARIVKHLSENQTNDIDFIVANTKLRILNKSKISKKVHLGKQNAFGFWFRSNPEKGKKSAEESLDELFKEIGQTNVLFITAGLGGGTGTGASPVIAKAAREKGILTVAVVTKPFEFEGKSKNTISQTGLSELQRVSDSTILIPNEKIFSGYGLESMMKYDFRKCFKAVDEVLFSSIKSLMNFLLLPNFADMFSATRGKGVSIFTTGEASGENRAKEAIEKALNNPFLEVAFLKESKNVLLGIFGGKDKEVLEIVAHVKEFVHPTTDVMWRSTTNINSNNEIYILLIITGELKNLG